MSNRPNPTPTPQTTVGTKKITAAELLRTPMDPLEMVVGDLIPAGLFLVAGDPKVGKSLAFTDLSLAIAQGEPAWGTFDVDAGDVLYIANEGGEHSFRGRLATMIGMSSESVLAEDDDRNDPLERFEVWETDRRLGGPLEEELDEWLNSVSSPRLVVIDTLSSVAVAGTGRDRHLEDYQALATMAQLCASWPRTLVVLVHHTNKSEGTTVTQRISGSNGLAAATDGIGTLSRSEGSRRATLELIPRNAEESSIKLLRQENLRWTVEGGAEGRQLSPNRQRIVAALVTSPVPLSPKQLADLLGISEGTVRKAVVDLSGRGIIAKDAYGLYHCFPQ